MLYSSLEATSWFARAGDSNASTLLLLFHHVFFQTPSNPPATDITARKLAMAINQYLT
jgi:hypothetical protein